MKLLGIVGLLALFLMVSMNLFVMLVMYLAEDYHVPDYVKIYELFESDRYQKVRQQLMAHNYTILIGNDQTGAKNFIEHQANIRAAEGKPVVVKRYQSISQHKQKLLKKIKETKFYMELVLGFGRKERTEVFFIKSPDQLPFDEINFIREKYPSDNIIIISEDDFSTKVPGFKKLHFPGVTMKEMKKNMMLYYRLSSDEADKLIESRNYSIERIFEYFKRKSKFQSEIDDELIDVEDIEDLNEIAEEMAEKEIRKLKAKEKREQEKSKKKKQKRKK